MNARLARSSFAVAATLIGAACAGAPTTSASATGATGSADLAELEALYYARADSARMDVHEADVAFMQGMIGHHAQALAMSELAPGRAGSQALRTLAARTINAQNDEIESMQGWLAERGQEVPEARHDHASMHASMPGMLSPEQMRELEAARGLEFDRLFLIYMIQHHSGAVTMVHELFATDGAALDDTVFKIASDIQVDQMTEIDRMQLMLDAIPSSR
jgi:uncharacterized protein (DUF305 family)